MANFACLIALVWVGRLSLSHEEVKRAVGLFYGFVLAIPSAQGSFFYLNTDYMIKRK